MSVTNTPKKHSKVKVPLFSVFSAFEYSYFMYEQETRKAEDGEDGWLIALPSKEKAGGLGDVPEMDLGAVPEEASHRYSPPCPDLPITKIAMK